MRAGELEATMRRLGLLLIVTLLLQVRVGGRAVLVPFFAVAGVWMLQRLRPLAQSPVARQCWVAAVAAAVTLALVGVAGWMPPVEPGGTTLVVALVTLAGLAGYAQLFEVWSVSVRWADAEMLMRRARRLLLADALVAVVGAALLVALGDPGTGLRDGPFLPSTVLGRNFAGPAVVVGLIVFTMMWGAAALTLQLGSKTIRAGLSEDPDRAMPTA